MNTQDTTQSGNELDPVITDQLLVQPIANEDVTVQPADEPKDPAPAPAPASEKDEPPADPRAARMEALADRSRNRETDELTEMTEATVNPAQPAPAPAPEPAPAERMIKLKVRGETVELPESEVIARAQKNDAAVNMPRPIISTRLRPKRSASAPAGSSNDAKESV